MSNGYSPQGGQGGGGYPPQQGQPQYPQQGQQQGQPQYPQQGQQQGQPQYPQQGQQQGGPQQQGGYQQPSGQYRQGPTGPRASFGQRLGAYVIDYLIFAVPLFLVATVLGVFSAATVEFNPETGEIASSGGPGAGALLLFYLLAIGAPLLYFGYFEGGPTGQTIGKKVLGIRVIRKQDGQPLGWGLAIGRYFARALSSICLLGYLWMLWDSEKQTWHDKLTNTVSVPLTAYPLQQGGGQQQNYGQYR